MSFFRFEAKDLPSTVGTNTDDGRRLTTGELGHLSYGPYLDADPGVYTAGFYLRRFGRPDDRVFHISVAAGAVEFATRDVPQATLFEDIPTYIHVGFDLSEPVKGLEVRLAVPESMDLELLSMVMFRSPARTANAVR